MKIQVLIAAVISSFILYGCEDNETNYLELSESSFSNVDGDGATLTVSVTSDVEWQISKTAQWCNVTPGKGSGNQTLTLQIEANPDSKERKVTVTVASPATKMSRKIEITQAAGYTPIEQYHYNLPVVFHVLYQNKSDAQQYVSPNRLSESIPIRTEELVLPLLCIHQQPVHQRRKYGNHIQTSRHYRYIGS